MMELFPGQAEREVLCGHIPRAPEAIGRYKTFLSQKMQLKMQRFSHVIHMALAEAEKTKPPEASSCKCQSYLSESQFLFGGEWGRKINILSVLLEVSVSGHRLQLSLELQEVFFSTGFHVSPLSLDFLPDSLQFPCFSPLFTAFTIYSCPFHKNCSGLSSSLCNGTHNWNLLNPLQMYLYQLIEMDGW